MPYVTKHTIVQHSGFGYNEDPTFARGLESRTVNSKADERKVILAGGVIFDSYTEAEDFAEKAMYPPEAVTLVPQARGTFAEETIDGLRVYIPIRELIG